MIVNFKNSILLIANGVAREIDLSVSKPATQALEIANDSEYSEMT